MKLIAQVAPRLCLFAALAVMTACSSGGGGSGSPAGGSPSTPIVPPPVTPTSPKLSIPAALPPTMGGNLPNQAIGAASLLPNPPAGTEFTLLHTALDLVDKTTVASVNAGRGTLSVESIGTDGVAHLRLELPDLGIDASDLVFSDASGVTSLAILASGPTVGLKMERKTYMSFGNWLINRGDVNSAVFTQGAAVIGYQTPAAGVPTTGMASYTSSDSVRGIVMASVTGSGKTQVEWANLSGGNVALEVDFGAGQLKGLLSGIALDGQGPSHSWNQVKLSGTLSGGTFSGTTSNDTPLSLNEPLILGPSTGSFSGAFYGPAAQQAGGVWTLSQTDGHASAIGVFGADKN